MADYDIFREQLAIKYPSYGYALWDPSPTNPNRPVQVGDVGFIHEGRFHRLFNALLPAGDPSQEYGVPEYYKPLVPTLSDHVATSFFGPNDYCSAGVKVEVDPGYHSSPDDLPQVLFRNETTRAAAVLSRPVKSRHENTLIKNVFGRWMVKHIDNWFAFAQNLGPVRQMEEIILVTGCDLTRSWSNIAFLGGRADAQASFGLEVRGSTSNPDVNFQFLPGRVRGAVLHCGPEGSDLPENQCVFIRGFRVAPSVYFLPKRLKAAAGPSPDPGYDCDSDLEVISIPGTTQFRDPLHLLSDYISEQASDCNKILIHDNDLLMIDGIGPDTVLESLEPDVMADLFRKSDIKIHKFECDSCPTESPSSLDTNTLNVKVATVSMTFQDWNPTPPSQWPPLPAQNVDLSLTTELRGTSRPTIPRNLSVPTFSLQPEHDSSAPSNSQELRFCVPRDRGQSVGTDRRHCSMNNCGHNYPNVSSGTGDPCDSSSYMNAKVAESDFGLRSTHDRMRALLSAYSTSSQSVHRVQGIEPERMAVRLETETQCNGAGEATKKDEARTKVYEAPRLVIKPWQSLEKAERIEARARRVEAVAKMLEAAVQQKVPDTKREEAAAEKKHEAEAQRKEEEAQRGELDARRRLDALPRKMFARRMEEKGARRLKERVRKEEEARRKVDETRRRKKKNDPRTVTKEERKPRPAQEKAMPHALGSSSHERNEVRGADDTAPRLGTTKAASDSCSAEVHSAAPQPKNQSNAQGRVQTKWQRDRAPEERRWKARNEVEWREWWHRLEQQRFLEEKRREEERHQRDREEQVRLEKERSRQEQARHDSEDLVRRERKQKGQLLADEILSRQQPNRKEKEISSNRFRKDRETFNKQKSNRVGEEKLANDFIKDFKAYDEQRSNRVEKKTLANHFIKDHETTLHLASQGGHVKVAHTLIERGADTFKEQRSNRVEKEREANPLRKDQRLLTSEGRHSTTILKEQHRKVGEQRHQCDRVPQQQKEISELRAEGEQKFGQVVEHSQPTMERERWDNVGMAFGASFPHRLAGPTSAPAGNRASALPKPNPIFPNTRQWVPKPHTSASKLEEEEREWAWRMEGRARQEGEREQFEQVQLGVGKNGAREQEKRVELCGVGAERPCHQENPQFDNECKRT